MAGVALALAGAEDVDALAALYAACLDDGWSAEALARLLATPEGFAVIARIDDVPQAFALARVVAEDCELLALGTRPGARRRGLARRLVAALAREAARRGARAMFLEVAEDNRAARALYAAAGFARAGRRPAYYARPGNAGAGGAAAALVLRRDLDARGVA